MSHIGALIRTMKDALESLKAGNHKDFEKNNAKADSEAEVTFSNEETKPTKLINPESERKVTKVVPDPLGIPTVLESTDSNSMNKFLIGG